MPRVSRFTVVAIVVAGVCVCACAPQAAPEPQGAVTMRIGMGAPRGTPGTGAGTLIRVLTSEPWLTNKQDGRQAERLATGWTWDQTGTILKLKLRRDVYFHDGTPLTPQVAAEALRLTAKNADQEGLSFKSVLSVEPVGDDTVEIRLREPNSFIIPDLSGVLVVKPGHAQIGTGPFRIASQTEDGARLSAFDRYYRGKPGLSEIDIRNYQTQRKAWTALMRSEVDMLHEVSRDAAEFVEAESTVKSYRFPRPYYIPLVFNVRHPVLKNPEVRKAITQALDRVALVRDGLNGRGQPADSPVWPQHWAYSPRSTPQVSDPAAARSRLDGAGYSARPNRDGTVPARFSFKCLVFANDSRFERIAILVQKQLADIGVDMQLEPVRFADFVRLTSAGEFDAFIFEMAGRSLSRVYDFWRSQEHSLNNSGYRAADGALDRIRAARTDDETRAAVEELERIFDEDPPAAFLAWQETTRAVSVKFDVEPEESRDILSNIWQWHPAAPGRQAAR